MTRHRERPRAQKPVTVRVEKEGEGWVARGGGEEGRGPGPLAAARELVKRLEDKRHTHHTHKTAK